MEFIKWLVTSSADPQNYSLMVKGALSIGAAYLLQLTRKIWLNRWSAYPTPPKGPVQ
jgi:hypothetical protein